MRAMAERSGELYVATDSGVFVGPDGTLAPPRRPHRARQCRPQ